MKIIFFKKEKLTPQFLWSIRKEKWETKSLKKKKKNISHFLWLSPGENEMFKLAGLLLALEIAKFIFITIEW